MSRRRLLAAGLLLAVAAAVLGAAGELWRFGASDAAAAARVEQSVRSDFDRMTAVLARIATAVAVDPDAARGLAAGADGARALFDVVDRRLLEAATRPDAVAATIYDTGGVARAWVGRPSDIRVPARLAGPSSFFVTPSPMGLRLVHILPIVDAEQRRVGSVAAEHVLSPAPAAATIAALDTAIETPFGSVALRMRWEGAGDQPRPKAFLLHAPGGEPLVEASIAPREIAEARNFWRRQVAAVVLVVFGITILLLIGPLLDRRAAAVQPGPFVEATLSAVGLLAAGAATL